MTDDLSTIADQYSFRPPYPDETPSQYRRSLAAFVKPFDMIKAHEIRINKEYSQWNSADRADFFRE